MRSFAIASTSTSHTPVLVRRGALVRFGVSTVTAARRPLGVRVSASASSDKDTSSVTTTTSSRGGTPGSWNLGVKNSDASGTEARAFVDRLFKAYPVLVAAAKDGDVSKLETVMDDVYVTAPDKGTGKIRDAQVRAAALEAVAAGKHQTLRALLDRGADLGFENDHEANKVDKKNPGAEAAVAAASKGHAVVLDILLERCGVSPYSVDTQTGRTLLACAAANGQERCVARVMGCFFSTDETAFAARDVSTACRSYLNAVDSNGSTASMLAAEFGHAGVLNQLRGSGCDMEVARQGDGMTAMGIHRDRTQKSIAEAFSRRKKGQPK